jgi:hypothetical protein
VGSVVRRVAAHLFAQQSALLGRKAALRGALHGGRRAVMRFNAVPQVAALNARRAFACWLRPARAGGPDEGEQED